MLTTVLFDMGGTLEDIWTSEETKRCALQGVRNTLQAHGLEPGVDDLQFQELVMEGIRAYKKWCDLEFHEKKPEEIWPEYYLKSFHFDRETLGVICEELANQWECTYFHRELRPGVKEMLEQLKARGYRMGVISNNASLYQVFHVLDAHGIRAYMEDVAVSSITGYRKPHPEIFRISMHQMQERPENCVYVGDTLSRDIIGPKTFGFAKAVLIRSFLTAQKDAGVPTHICPDATIERMEELVPWLDRVNPEMALKASTKTIEGACKQ